MQLSISEEQGLTFNFIGVKALIEPLLVNQVLKMYQNLRNKPTLIFERALDEWGECMSNNCGPRSFGWEPLLYVFIGVVFIQVIWDPWLKQFLWTTIYSYELKP